MKEKRSFFEMIFGFPYKAEEKSMQSVKLLNGYTNMFSAFTGAAYDDPTVRDCIETIAKHFGKLKIRQVNKSADKVVPVQDKKLLYLLTTRPNQFMTASEFLEKIASQYYTYNNAFVDVRRNRKGGIEGLYPLEFSTVELVKPTVGKPELFVRFTFMNGERVTRPYTDIIHIRRYYNRDEFYGDRNEKIMLDDINVLRAVKMSVVNKVSNFGKLRGILQWKSTLRPEDQKRAWQEFVDTYANTGNGSGIASLDNKADYIPLPDNDADFNADQMEYARKSVLSHFGLSDAIISGKYTEDDFISFYESVIEPLAVKLAQEFTEKLLTSNERLTGNEIILESNRLSFMSVASKIKICQTLIPAGGFTINEIREIFGYAAIEGGDERQVSLNFVNAKDQSQYQVNKKGGEDDGQKIKRRMQVGEQIKSTDKEERQRITGYAAVYNEMTTLYRIGDWEYREIIEPGAFNTADMTNVVLNYNHGKAGYILARTSNDTLRLSIDNHGLKIDADIINTTDGCDVYKLIQRGDINKMSYAFTSDKESMEWDERAKVCTRRIQSIEKVYDVSVVVNPAYEGTSVSTRDAGVDEFEQMLRKRAVLATYL